MRDLGALGGRESVARDVNNVGEVVGWAAAAGGERRASLFAAGRLQDLNMLLPAESGWILVAAHAINDAGQIIGAATLHGRSCAFLLTPAGRELATDRISDRVTASSRKPPYRRTPALPQ